MITSKVNEESMITKKALAARYGVTARTITNWMRCRRVSYLKAGRIVRFDPVKTDDELKRTGWVQAV